MEAICSSETSGYLRNTRLCNPEDYILHSHLRENRKPTTGSLYAQRRAEMAVGYGISFVHCLSDMQMGVLYIFPFIGFFLSCFNIQFFIKPNIFIRIPFIQFIKTFSQKIVTGNERTSSIAVSLPVTGRYWRAHRSPTSIMPAPPTNGPQIYISLTVKMAAEIVVETL
jgi:hypothetical protein